MREVTTRLDTIRLFPHRERGVLVYRGMVQIARTTPPTSRSLMLACEDPTAPLPVAHYEGVLAARLDRKHGALLSLKDDDLMPPAALGWVPRAEKGDVEHMVEKQDHLAKNLRRRQESERQKARERVVARGLDPAAFNLAEPPADEPAPDLADIDAVVARMDREKEASDGKVKELEAKKAQMEAKARATFAARGQDYDAALAKARRDASGPPRFRARPQIALMKENLAIARAGGAPLLDLEQKAEDPSYLAELEAKERDLFEVYKKSAHFQHPAGRAEGSDRIRAEIYAAHHNGIALHGRDFTGADLSRSRSPASISRAPSSSRWT